MNKKKYNQILKEKLEINTSKHLDDQIVRIIESSMKSKTKIVNFDWAQIFAPSLAFALVLFIFLTSHNNPLELNDNDPIVLTALVENVDFLDNLSGLSEIDEIEELTEDDWEILLGGIEDV